MKTRQFLIWHKQFSLILFHICLIFQRFAGKSIGGPFPHLLQCRGERHYISDNKLLPCPVDRRKRRAALPKISMAALCLPVSKYSFCQARVSSQSVETGTALFAVVILFQYLLQQFQAQGQRSLHRLRSRLHLLFRRSLLRHPTASRIPCRFARQS